MGGLAAWTLHEQSADGLRRSGNEVNSQEINLRRSKAQAKVHQRHRVGCGESEEREKALRKGIEKMLREAD